MQVTLEKAPEFYGVRLGRDHWRLTFNQRELATLQKANAICEEAREQLRESMGEEAFQDSPYYRLEVWDCIDTPIEIENENGDQRRV